jgi:chitin synthase
MMVTPNTLSDLSPPLMGERTADLYVAPKRVPTALLVCLTLYNEPADSLATSLAALARTCAPLLKAGASGAGDDTSLPRIVIAVIADGSEALAQSTRSFLAGLTREVPAPTDAGDVPVANWEGDRSFGRFSADQLARLCEPWTSDNRPPNAAEVIDSEQMRAGSNTSAEVELHVFIKPLNAGKLDSHSLFFTRICPELQPKYCIQMDAGTAPKPDCLPKLIAELSALPGCIACFPTIVTDRQPRKSLITFQHYDLLIANGLGWSFSALFNYAEVIPGQFCILRWGEMRLGSPSLIDRYLQAGHGHSSLAAMMALTEDRVLAKDLMLKAHKSSCPVVSHVVDAIAITDPCLSWSELLRQRRRWLNGSAAVHLATLAALTEMVAGGDVSSQGAKGDGTCRMIAAAINGVLALLWFWLGGALPLVVLICLVEVLADPDCSLETGWCAAVRVGCLLAASFWLLQAGLLAREDTGSMGGMDLLPWCSLAQVAGGAALITLASARDGLALISIVILVVAFAAAEVTTARWSPSLSQRSGWLLRPWWPLLLPILSSSLAVYAIAHLPDQSWGTKGLVQHQEATRTNPAQPWMGSTAMRLRNLFTWLGLTVVGLTMATIIVGWPTGWIVGLVVGLVGAVGVLAVLTRHSRVRNRLGQGWSDPWLIWLPSTAALLLVLHHLQNHQILLNLIPLTLLGISAMVVASSMAVVVRRHNLQRRRPRSGSSGEHWVWWLPESST